MGKRVMGGERQHGELKPGAKNSSLTKMRGSKPDDDPVKRLGKMAEEAASGVQTGPGSINIGLHPNGGLLRLTIIRDGKASTLVDLNAAAVEGLIANLRVFRAKLPKGAPMADERTRARSMLRSLIASRRAEVEALQEALATLESPMVRGLRSLSMEQVMEIRSTPRANITELARKFGVDRRTIRDVIQRKTYRQV